MRVKKKGWQQLQLPYKSHRTYSTNHMGSISQHITPLVINNLGAETHTCKQTHTSIQMFADRNNSKKPGARAWFKNQSAVISESSDQEGIFE